jgi:hypothetical protein
MSIAKLIALIKAVAGSGGGGGSGGGYLAVHDNNGTLDKTWREIRSAIDAGYYVSSIYSSDTDGAQTRLEMYEISNGKYNLKGYYYMDEHTMGEMLYSADSPDEYPVSQY